MLNLNTQVVALIDSKIEDGYLIGLRTNEKGGVDCEVELEDKNYSIIISANEVYATETLFNQELSQERIIKLLVAGKSLILKGRDTSKTLLIEVDDDCMYVLRDGKYTIFDEVNKKTIKNFITSTCMFDTFTGRIIKKKEY